MDCAEEIAYDPEEPIQYNYGGKEFSFWIFASFCVLCASVCAISMEEK